MKFEQQYKGFVKYREGTKKPSQKIQGEELLTLHHVRYRGNDGYGGVLNDDVIMVDIDDMREAEKLLEIVNSEGIKCNVLKTTDGMHFYFKHGGLVVRNIGSKHCTASIGFQSMDIKLGDRVTIDCLKYQGVEREWLKEEEWEEVEVIPKWLLPIPKNKFSFLGMDEGEGRNEELFRYILCLQGSKKFNKDEIKDILRMINKYMFVVSIQQDELEVIMRDDAFVESCGECEWFGEKGALLHEKFAKWLIDEHHIIRVNSQLYMYKNDEYVMCGKWLERIIIDAIPNITRNKRLEVISYINAYIVENTEMADCRYVSVGNGVLDLQSGKLQEHSPEWVITNKIDWEWDAECECGIVDTVLDRMSCGDRELRKLMEEMIGYCLVRRNELGIFFILTGDGGGGKSTFLDMVRRMLGEENVSSVGLQDISGKFEKTEIVGKLANIGDDISDVRIEDDSNLKKLITGESVQFQYKGRDVFSFRNYAKLLFASNEIPKFRDLSRGILRRMVIVPFMARFGRDVGGSSSSGEYDPYIADKLRSESAMKYLLKLGIAGVRRVLDAKGFTRVESVEQASKEFEEYNNNVIGFIAEMGEDVVIDQSPTNVYSKYKLWCAECGTTPYGQKKMFIQLKKLGMVSEVLWIDGKSVRKYGKSV